MINLLVPLFLLFPFLVYVFHPQFHPYSLYLCVLISFILSFILIPYIYVYLFHSSSLFKSKSSMSTIESRILLFPFLVCIVSSSYVPFSSSLSSNSFPSFVDLFVVAPAIALSLSLCCCVAAATALRLRCACSVVCELFLFVSDICLDMADILLIWLCLLKLEREAVHHESASEVRTGTALASISVLCWLMYV